MEPTPKNTSKRRKAFTIQEKGIIINRLENGETNSSLAKEFGVGHSTISAIFKSRDLIKKSLNSNVKAKRLRKSRQGSVEQALIQWYQMNKNQEILITGPMLRKKANDFALRFGISNFNCSASWITRFKVRYNIAAEKKVRESSSDDHTSTTDWMTSVWPNLRRQFSDDEIFNADETGLFYKLMPDKTMLFKGEICSGGYLSADRITVMVAANMSGTEKKELLVIGNSDKPVCSDKSLPVHYARDRRAWMTSEFFEKWLRDWDRDLVNENKKILLLVDDCLAHPKVTNLKCITLAFLPPITTSVLQPMNQGIIRSLKINFRKNLVFKMINHLEGNESNPFTEITMLDAILLLNDAWNKVSQSTIYNCFKRAGFIENDDGLLVTFKTEVEEIPLFFSTGNLYSEFLAPALWEEYVDVDSALLTSEESVDELIVQNINDKEQPVSDGAEDIVEDPWPTVDEPSPAEEEPSPAEEELSSDEEEPSPSAEEAFCAAELLARFVHTNIKDDRLSMAMSTIHNRIRDCYYKEMKNGRCRFPGRTMVTPRGVTSRRCVTSPHRVLYLRYKLP